MIARCKNVHIIAVVAKQCFLLCNFSGNLVRNMPSINRYFRLHVSFLFAQLRWNMMSQRQINVKYPAGIYLLKVNNRNTRTRCEICSKLTIKTPERRQWRRSGVFIVNFEHISHLVLVFLMLTLNM